jgi:predicted RecA/RadA family phage recombinase
MQNVNQFDMNAEAGELDLSLGLNNTMAAVFDPTATAVLLPGEAVKLIDLGANDYAGVNPLVGKRSGAADAGFTGLIVRSKKAAQLNASEVVDVALEGTVIRLKATAAITRGAPVYADFAHPGQVTATGTGAGPSVGVALDKAAAAGNMLRVLIKIGPALSAG